MAELSTCFYTLNNIPKATTEDRSISSGRASSSKGSMLKQRQTHRQKNIVLRFQAEYLQGTKALLFLVCIPFALILCVCFVDQKFN